MTHTIVVVEDNVANLKLLRDTLIRAGYEVHSAPDATTGLALVENARPDLVLLDIQLPGMDGITALKVLRARSSTKGVLVMAITAHAMRGDERRFLDAGFDAYLAKPIRYRNLLDSVKALLYQNKG